MAEVKTFNLNVNVKTQIENLGMKKVAYVLLSCVNTGGGIAENCQCALIPPHHTPGPNVDNIIEVETHLAYVPTDLFVNLTIGIGWEQYWEFGLLGKVMVKDISRAIPSHGGQARMLLAFVVEGLPKIFIGIGDGVASYPMGEYTLKLRTSSDNREHKVLLKAESWEKLGARVLND